MYVSLLFLTSFCVVVFANFDLERQFSVTPLSSLKTFPGVPVTQFDLNQLSQQPTPLDIRNYLAGQILKQSAPPPPPRSVQVAPPAAPQLRLPFQQSIAPPAQDLHCLQALTGLKSLRAPRASSFPLQQPDVQNNIVSTLSNLLSEFSKGKYENSKHRAPQICIQFIDVSPKALDHILHRHQQQSNFSAEPALFVNNARIPMGGSPSNPIPDSHHSYSSSASQTYNGNIPNGDQNRERALNENYAALPASHSQQQHNGASPSFLHGQEQTLTKALGEKELQPLPPPEMDSPLPPPSHVTHD